ncbi:carboxylating nicotinate-nucleotide diphosphorylase [Desulfovibrio litoralis]|uniref:nicotinate-nucleotide diphosphorylase (carboxylating) n=1 Tax=Desulfovibrio litoralis DSM 11393 TaxID=1121455 RepID=A0A1M7RXU9_9BACT|nr:carboxylating nicotinate-nucleotide diphosphorylase [Desulfovibrio litoralis]SHN50988.1 nicotinate-nucleotide pyrophosphorylase [carboxylating] [Desulfovibrio litoralis DSM 11393]
MQSVKFDDFFTGNAFIYLEKSIKLAVEEDGVDLGSFALFSNLSSSNKNTKETRVKAIIKAKEETPVVGLAFIPLIMKSVLDYNFNYVHSDNIKINDSCTLDQSWSWEALAQDGDLVKSGTIVATLSGSASLLLKAERVILNFITHLSGIAKLTRTYVKELEGGSTVLLDTRKTLPGLRYPEKYAVLMGGAKNHRKNLEEMLMLKDNHIDAVGSITKAVEILRNTYAKNCPPIEVECRTLDEVKEAVALKVERIMLDNMLNAPPFNENSFDLLTQALKLIPENIESEISGGINLDSLKFIAKLKPAPNFVSVGRLTHSASASDFSMVIDFNK